MGNNEIILHDDRPNEYIYQDCLFPTDNELEIPVLRLDRQAKVCDIPFLCFGEQARSHNMGGLGTLHFYTDDYRFNSVYEHPEKILNMHLRNIVEPNFSLFNDTPIAFGMQAVYKKRMTARLCQENGINIFVDLNVASKFYKCNMLGIPQGWSSFCTRGYSDRLNYLEFEAKIARTWAGDNNLLFVVYGGGEKVRKYCIENGLIYVTPIVAIKSKIEALKRIESTIAFSGVNLTSKEIDATAKQLFDNQIIGSDKMLKE